MTLLGAQHGYLEVEPHAPADRRSDREVILLLHGTGGNKFEWSFPPWRGLNYDHEHRPEDRHSNNHRFPPVNPLDVVLDFSLSDKRDVRCWTSILTALGHTVIYYSQDGADDRIDVALDQLENLIVPFIRDEVLTGPLTGKRVVIIGHSRGGILARLYLARHANDAAAWIQHVITLCSPHAGTNAPRAARRLRDEIEALVFGGFPAVARLLFPPLEHLPLIGADVEPTDAQAQLVPEDPLFGDLSMPDDTPDIGFHTYGGSSVTLTRVYYWQYTLDSFVPRWDFLDILPHFDWTKFPIEILPVSPILDSLPNDLVFAEQREGQGDICVTIESAQLPGVPHQSLPINHAEAFFDETLFARVSDVLGTPLGGIAVDECTSGWIGNRRTRELHDISGARRNCQIDEIVDREPFRLPSDAFDAGYDGCYYCMRDQHRR